MYIIPFGFLFTMRLLDPGATAHMVVRLPALLPHLEQADWELRSFDCGAPTHSSLPVRAGASEEVRRQPED